MDAPSEGRIIDSIESSLDPEWFGEGEFPIYREGNRLWIRFTPECQQVFKITVEKVPREQWPRPPAV